MKITLSFIIAIFLTLSAMSQSNVYKMQAASMQSIKNNKLKLGHEMEVDKSFKKKPSQASHFKNKKTMTQKLDSIYYTTVLDSVNGIFQIKRYEFNYDINGNLLSTIFSIPDLNTNELIEQEKEEFAYDTNGNLLSYIMTFRNSETSQWIGQIKTINTYNSSNNLILLLNYSWLLDPGEWYISGKEEYFYDANDSLIQKIEYQLQTGTNLLLPHYNYQYVFNPNGSLAETYYHDYDNSGSLMNYTKSEYIYDEEGNNTTIMYYSSFTENLTLFAKEEYTYDANGNIITSIFSYWKSDIQQWQYDSKIENTYDANNNKIVQIYSQPAANSHLWYFTTKIENTFVNNTETQSLYYWFMDLEQWKIADKQEYTVNSNGDFLTIINYHPDNSGALFIISKYEYIYDTNGNNITYFEYEYDAYSGEFVYGLKNEFSYNDVFSFEDLVLPTKSYAVGFCLQTDYNMLIENKSYKRVDNNWVSDLKINYYYSSTTSINDVENTNGIIAYPNPAFNKVQFLNVGSSNISIDIFNMQGLKVLSQINKGNTISVDNLAKGMYIYKIADKNNNYTGKLVVE